ncbi:MAG TPA: lycopene cyclase domain-containing protein [Ignavibacteria bacterium]|nr:lycopene cyclase domain-containing protein [Ignavibacteria bacterium]
MTTYLLINIFIILIPLILSFEKNVKFYKKFSNVFATILIVGIIFIIWDIVAVKRGDWSFNTDFTFNKTLFGLPFEEILFFITVPYSIIFVYESLSFYFKDKKYNVSKFIYLIFAFIFIALALINFDRNYTFTLLLYCGLIFLTSFFGIHKVMFTRVILITLLISFIPFLIVNYILTSLPVVEYNPEAITGIRVSTIPIEDFFYSFSMITSWLIVYNFLKTRRVEKTSAI